MPEVLVPNAHSSSITGSSKEFSNTVKFHIIKIPHS